MISKQFHALITEFRYINTNGIIKEDGSFPSTYGDGGRFRHTYTKHQIGNGLRGMVVVITHILGL